MSEPVLFEGSLLLVQPGERARRLACAWRWYLEAERARGRRPCEDDLRFGCELERLASADASGSGSAEVVPDEGSVMLVVDEMSTLEAAAMLGLNSDRQVRNLCTSGLLRSRMVGRRWLVETRSVLEEATRRQSEAAR